MSQSLPQRGEHALVLGGGIAGSLACKALSKQFERVTQVERDAGPEPDGYRKGVPQGRQVHQILRGGLEAIERLFPGFEDELYAGGAVRARIARDLAFIDRLGLWPNRDIGLECPMQSRALVERCLAARLETIDNLELRRPAQVLSLLTEGERVVGASCRTDDGHLELRADLVIDATGRSAHALEWMERMGFAPPPETRIEVDIAYAGYFVRAREPMEKKGVLFMSGPPDGRYGVLIQQQEDDRLLVSFGSRGRDTVLPTDHEGLLALAKSLPHDAPYRVLSQCEPLTKIARFAFPASVRRHFEQLTRRPEGLVCIGDTLCTFNPIWGQGMSVAALEVAALDDLLTEAAGDPAALSTLPERFYGAAAQLINTPWQLSALPDLAYETTRGESAEAARQIGAFSGALGRLAQQDPEVHALLLDVYHLIKPRELLAAPELVERVLPLMQSA